MITYYGSGYITYRNRKVGTVWTGSNAEHIHHEFTANSNSHPWLHIRIQQLARLVKNWKPDRNNKSILYGYVTDNETGYPAFVIIEIKGKFAFIKTCYKKGGLS